MHRSTRKSAQQWQQIIQQQEDSPLSQRDYCQQQGLSYASFAKWRQKIKKNNQAFLPIAHEETIRPASNFSLAITWGKFSLSMTGR